MALFLGFDTGLILGTTRGSCIGTVYLKAATTQKKLLDIFFFLDLF